MSSNGFTFQLKPLVTMLVVNTNPRAQVSLGGQVAGTANEQGVFAKEGLNAGVYTVEVSLPGYTPHNERVHLGAPRASVSTWLNVSPQRQQQIEAERQRGEQDRARFETLLREADTQFRSRQYKPALASVEEALKLQPGEARAERLKSQIQKTLDILR